jgi:hypothetical protein
VSQRSAIWLLALLGVLTVAVVAWWSLAPAPSHTRVESDAAPHLRPEQARVREDGRQSTPRSGAKRIHARIVEPSIGPLSEGRIEVHCTGSAGHAAVLLENGEFEALACDSGPSCVRLIHPSLQQPHAWELDAGAVVELEAEVAPRLSGTVVGPEYESVPAADVLVHRGTTRVAVGTDDAGEFAVAWPRLRPCDRCDVGNPEARCQAGPPESDRGTVRVFVSAPGLAPAEIELDLDGEPSVEIVLSAAAPALVGRVLGADGEPFDRTVVFASNLARDYEQHVTQVDAEGRFEFASLAEGEYSLRAIRDERELATLAVARPGEQVELRSDQSAPGSAVTVEIVDADGEPVSGARVDGGPWRAALSDADGRVEASAVLPGSYTVRVRADGCAPVRETIVVAPEQARWLVRLPANC